MRTALHLFGKQSTKMSQLYLNLSLGLILKHVLVIPDSDMLFFPSNIVVSSRIISLHRLLCYNSMFDMSPFTITL